MPLYELRENAENRIRVSPNTVKSVHMGTAASIAAIIHTFASTSLQNGRQEGEPGTKAVARPLFLRLLAHQLICEANCGVCRRHSALGATEPWPPAFYLSLQATF